MVALKFAALAGVGVAQLPATVVRADLVQGRLVEVLPRWTPRRELVHALFPSRRGLLPAIRHLLDFLAGEFATLCRVEQISEQETDAELRRQSSSPA
jgi:DNA-binding transcriptional LysR family regulator